MGGAGGGGLGGQGCLLTFRPLPRQPACSVPQFPHPQGPRGMGVQMREHLCTGTCAPGVWLSPPATVTPKSGGPCPFVNQYQWGALKMMECDLSPSKQPRGVLWGPPPMGGT